jgi:hypothetical protein
MIDALTKRVPVTYKCYEMYVHRGKLKKCPILGRPADVIIITLRNRSKSFI